jgi:hypothetical protein
VRYLAHTTEQAEAVQALYRKSAQDLHKFEIGNAGSQQIAQALLLQLGLDRAARAALDGRWNVQWSTKWAVGQEGDFRKRILFQW